MADEGEDNLAGESSAGKWILLALAVLYIAGSLYFIFDLRGRLDKMSKDQAAAVYSLPTWASACSPRKLTTRPWPINWA